MKRYALYYAPAAEAPLTRTASSWLGHCAFTGAMPPAPDADGLSRAQWEAVTADPRVYGFHATLKAPFRMADGGSPEDLRDRLRAFAATRRPFEVRLELGSLASFLALVLAVPSPDFVELAADCVRFFDGFRAPPPAEELARRRQARLNEAQLAHLARWGYPYCMEEWRFHMTLTGSLDPPTFDRARRRLAALFEPLCREPQRVDSICLFEQETAGAPFIVRERFGFR